MKYKTEILPKISDLAEYLGVSASAVYQYDKDKRLLMLLGLKHKREIDAEKGVEKTRNS